MKRQIQIKMYVTEDEAEQLKREANEANISVNELLRNRAFSYENQASVKPQTDPALDWLALCERYPDLKMMYDLIINEHSPSLYKLNKTVEQHQGAIQELYKRSVLE